MRTRLFIVVSVLLVATMVLGACAQPPAPAPQAPAVTKIVETVVVTVPGESKTVIITATPAPTEPPPAAPAGPKVLRWNMGPGDVPTLDPSVAEDTTSIQIVAETMGGLTRLDEEKVTVGPHLAESWDISQDGKVYTFHMRKDVPWVKWDAAKNAVAKVQDCAGADRMVNAFDYAYGFLRTIAPKTASPYAYVLDFAIDGAQDYTDGKAKDTSKVGVTAVDTYTLQLTFKEPAAYNPNIAGMWVGYAEPKWLIEGDDCTEARGERWIETGFNQSYGPFALKEWVHDSELTIVKNPFWPGTPNSPQPKIDEVTITMLDEPPAFAEYEAGNLDRATVPLADMDRVKADPTLSKELKISPSMCTYYYGFNTTAPVVSDVRMRQALSEAVDRQSLIDNVVKGNQEPAQWFARPGLVGSPTIADHPDLGVKYNVDDAKTKLNAYLTDNKTTADKVDLTLMFNTSAGHQKIAEAIQQMWKDNLGLNVKLVNQEWKVYLVTTKSKDTPQLFRMGWCMDYPDANNFDREVVAAGGSQNPTDNAGKPSGGFMWKNDKYEQLVLDAAKEMDPAKRIDLYAQAEQIISWEDPVMIPIYWYTSVEVTKPNITRTFSMTGGEQHWEKWDIAQ